METIIRKTITQTFLDRCQKYSKEVGFRFKPTHTEMGPVGKWKELTYGEFYHHCALASFGLMGSGTEKGDRICLMSNTRVEWSLSDMAILGAQAVTVPIYASSTSEDTAYILEHSEAKILFVEDTQMLKKVLSFRAENPDRVVCLEKIVVFEPTAVAAALEYPDFAKHVLTFQALQEIGKRQQSRTPLRFEENLKSLQEKDWLTICYTSGTTGVPKGVVLTHENMMSVLEDCSGIFERMEKKNRTIILSFLPFSHIFGKVESMVVYALGWEQVFAESLEKLLDNLSDAKPTVLFSVPRVFEKIFTKVHASVEASGSLKKNLFAWAERVGTEYYSYVNQKKRPPKKVELSYALAEKLVFHKIKKPLGGNLEFALSGGAPLPKKVAEFFQIIGVQILEGYGLTETCAPVTLNSPMDYRLGSVGKPLPEVSIKVAEDGEILVRSKKVFQAYYKMPEATEEVLQDGWFHTGDIGKIDSDGFLFITDRKKDLIITSGGKNIAPQKIEKIAKNSKLFSQFVVHGDRRNYLTALVTLEKDQVIQYADEKQILYSGYAELIRNTKVLQWVQEAMDQVNSQLATYESIKKFTVLEHDFTIDTGELTPSLKVKRAVVNRKYQGELDRMYQ